MLQGGLWGPLSSGDVGWRICRRLIRLGKRATNFLRLGSLGAPRPAHFSAHLPAHPGFSADLLLPRLLPSAGGGVGLQVRGGLTTPPLPPPPLPCAAWGAVHAPAEHSGQLGAGPSGQPPSPGSHSSPARFTFRFLAVPSCSSLCFPILSVFHFPSWLVAVGAVPGGPRGDAQCLESPGPTP